MNKLAKFLMLPIALCTALGFAACQDNTTSSSDSSTSSEPINSSSSVSSSEEAYVAPTTVADAVATAKKNANKVVTGTGTMTTLDPSTEDSAETNVSYGLISGKYFEYVATGTYSKEEYRYALLADGNVYGLHVEYTAEWDEDYVNVVGFTDGSIYLVPETTAANVAGYGFSIGSDDFLAANGVENWLDAMYTVAKNIPAERKTNVAFSESVNDGTYTFAFDFAKELYYKVNVSFTLDETGMLDDCSWNVSIWYYGQEQDEDGNWLTMTLEDETVVPATSEGTKADFAWDTEKACWYLVDAEKSCDSYETFAFKQSQEGEVTDRASTYRMTSMSIKTADDEALPETLTMTLGSDVILTMADVLPTTATFATNDISVVISGEDEYGLSAEVSYYDWDLNETYPDKIKITASKVGTYPVSIMLNGTKIASTTITVKKPLPTSLAVGAWTEDWGMYTSTDISDGYKMYLGQSVTLAGIVDNQYASGNAEITIMITEDHAADGCVTTTVTTTAGEISAVCFTPITLGTYKVTMASTEAELTATATIEVVPAPLYQNILEGEYKVWDDMSDVEVGTISFVDGKATISLTIESFDWDAWGDVSTTYTAVYSYTISGDSGSQTLTLTKDSGDGCISFMINDNYELIVTYDENFGTDFAGEFLTEFTTVKVTVAE